MRPLQVFDLSAGERRLALAYMAVGGFGAILAMTVLQRLEAGPVSLNPGTVWMLLSGAIGAMTALHLRRDHLGRAGLPGLGRAVISGLWITVVGGLIAGTLALPVYGTMFGTWLLLVVLAQTPIMTLLWAMMLGACHMMLGRWRAERDSVFRPIVRRRRLGF